jgi:hypothetical protein
VKCKFGYMGIKSVRMACMFCMVRIKDEKDIVNIIQTVYDHTLFYLLCDV